MTPQWNVFPFKNSWHFEIKTMRNHNTNQIKSKYKNRNKHKQTQKKNVFDCSSKQHQTKKL